MSDDWWIEWRQGHELCRVPIRGRLTLGRSAQCDVVVDDPYVSRVHCTVEVVDGAVFVDARNALNLVRVSGRDVETARLGSDELCLVGNTTFRFLGPNHITTEETLRLAPPQPAGLVLRASTRELCQGDETIAQFSMSEFLVFQAIARKHPDAASHPELGEAVWGGLGYDQYQLHRLLQRVRLRMGNFGGLLENVRGTGYRLKASVKLA